MLSTSSAIDSLRPMRSTRPLCFACPQAHIPRVARGANGATGNALVEVYRLD